MNILFYLLPKKDVDYLYDDFTVRQALEKIRERHYSMVPIVNRETGKYCRSLMEGDFLDYLIENRLSFDDLEKEKIASVPSSRDIKAVGASCDVSELYKILIDQNFVPVVDDDGTFIGIVTRKSVMNELFKPRRL